MAKIMLDHGEVRHIRIKIFSLNNAPFQIKSARYEIFRGSEPGDAGECAIDGHVIDAYITAPEVKTAYKLRIIYEINDETLVEQIELVVV